MVEYKLDEEKIADEEKYDGYYEVVTNLLEPAKDILVVSRKRYQIKSGYHRLQSMLMARVSLA